ncbi:FAR1-related protein, partial [Striga asiatica]
MDLNITQTGTQPYAGRQHLSITPGGTKYWIPDCDESLKPRKGQKFQSIDAAIDFYKEYACFVGFDVRHSTLIKAKDKTTIWRYLVCSREGYKHHSQPNHSIQTEGRREHWIPAFFINVKMSGLMRTTSRSESENI